MSAVLKEVEKKEVVPSLAPDRMQVGDFVRQVVCVTVEVGTRPEWLLDPKFWAHVANKVRPYDRIEARCDDGEFFAEYLVLQRGPQWLKVKQLSMHKLGADVVEDGVNLTHDVMFLGPKLKWCVVRKSDKARVQEGIEDKAEAFAAAHRFSAA
jgi:hypothetical protein